MSISMAAKRSANKLSLSPCGLAFTAVIRYAPLKHHIVAFAMKSRRRRKNQRYSRRAHRNKAAGRQFHHQFDEIFIIARIDK